MVSPIALPSAQQHRGQQSVLRRGKEHAVDDFPTAGAQRQGGFAVRVGHGPQGVFADGDDDRRAHQREDDAAVEEVDADRRPGQANDDRPHHHVADKSPDDRGNGREKLDERP